MPRNLNNITQTNGYTVVKPNIRNIWSAMYMAKTHSSTGNCGKIIPVFHRELIPGQTVNIDQDVAIQFTPFVSNLFHEINGELISYFVPYRICAFMRDRETLDDDIEQEADQLKWEAYITGGKSGRDTQKLPLFSFKHLRWEVENAAPTTEGYKEWIGGLCDYFGMPTHIPAIRGGDNEYDGPLPNQLLHQAYNMIYNVKLRNPDFTSWKWTSFKGNNAANDCQCNAVKTAYWNADRFTRARAIQLRGAAPAIPISNDTITLAHNITHTGSESGNIYGGSTDEITGFTLLTAQAESGSNDYQDRITLSTKNGGSGSTAERKLTTTTTISNHTIEQGQLNTSLNLNELLYNIGILQYETNMARVKPRYTDFLNSQFGIIPQDSRFQEPEWVSSNSFNVGVDTITATATTDADATAKQGNITSQAWGGGRSLRSEYRAQEHGVFMTLMIIKPKSVYEGGLERMLWSTRTRFDFPIPELMNLPDQKIYRGELKYTATENDTQLFGWEQIFDEYRTMTNQVTGMLRPSLYGDTTNPGLSTYTLARFFNEAPTTINEDFLLCKPDMKRIKQYQNQPDFIFFVRTEMRTAIPMPMITNPVNIATT